MFLYSAIIFSYFSVDAMNWTGERRAFFKPVHLI